MAFGSVVSAAIARQALGFGLTLSSCCTSGAGSCYDVSVSVAAGDGDSAYWRRVVHDDGEAACNMSVAVFSHRGQLGELGAAQPPRPSAGSSISV